MTIQSVPLTSLEPSRANPRGRFDTASIEGLAASIRTDGLLQNLVVRPINGRGEAARKQEGERFRIVSGERRYRALKLLAEQGDLAEDFTVPVEVRQRLSSEDSLRLATVENLQRQSLTPLEETAALTKLVRKRETLDDIAAQTGLSVSTIRRRLALNSLCEEAATALDAGALSLSQAEALTLGDDEKQRQILGEIRRGYQSFDAEDIKAILLDDRPTVALAIFPVEQYSGTITTDLFGEAEESYFDDAEQFMALQQQAAEQLAERHAESASWVEVTNAYRIPDWQYEEAGEGETGGVLINLSPSGKVEIREGLAKRQIDESTAKALADNPVAPSKPKASYSAPLCRYIAHHKSAAVAEVMLADPRKAREVAVVHLLDGFRVHEAIRALAESDEPQSAYTVLEAQARLYAGKLGFAIEDDETVWTALPPYGTDSESLYEAVKGLSDNDLEGLQTLLAALSFGQIVCEKLDTGDSLFNRVATDLGIDMKSHWRPDRSFLERRNREQLLIISDECGCAERYGIGMLRGFKKSELVSCLLRHFEQARTTDEEGEAWQKARDWLPEVMRFPAIDPGAPEDAGAGEDAEAEAA
ncbi:MAG: ParB/RepB/Spo0J family partition protein [Pseudohongiellaceae bacterium]